MSTPTVACVMLANGREAMVQRAVKSFQAQTYANKKLVIWNTGQLFGTQPFRGIRVWEPVAIRDNASVGTLRNRANYWAIEALDGIDLIAHWDSDDWSHPKRIEEQVALLEQTGADLTGYRDALFWNTRKQPAEAWLYRSEHPKMVIGASMMYRRELWELCPFEDIATAEDYRFWLQAVKDPGKVVSVSGIGSPYGRGSLTGELDNPRIVCEIHGSNTSPAYDNMHSSSWLRVPEYDGYAKGVMAL